MEDHHVNGLNQVRKVKELADTCTAMQHESLFLAGRQHSEPYGVILELEILKVTKEMSKANIPALIPGDPPCLPFLPLQLTQCHWTLQESYHK